MVGVFLISLSRIFFSIPSFFFLEDYHIWTIFEAIERTFLLVGMIFLGGGIYSLISPKYIKKIIIFFFLISVFILFGSIINPPTYFFTENGVLVLGNPPIVPSLLNFLFLLIITIPGTIYFLKMHFLQRLEK